MHYGQRTYLVAIVINRLDDEVPERSSKMLFVQDYKAAKLTHDYHGFAHKVFSLCYATTFDEVGRKANQAFLYHGSNI